MPAAADALSSSSSQDARSALLHKLINSHRQAHKLLAAQRAQAADMTRQTQRLHAALIAFFRAHQDGSVRSSGTSQQQQQREAVSPWEPAELWDADSLGLQYPRMVDLVTTLLATATHSVEGSVLAKSTAADSSVADYDAFVESLTDGSYFSSENRQSAVVPSPPAENARASSSDGQPQPSTDAVPTRSPEGGAGGSSTASKRSTSRGPAPVPAHLVDISPATSPNRLNSQKVGNESAAGEHTPARELQKDSSADRTTDGQAPATAAGDDAKAVAWTPVSAASSPSLAPSGRASAVVPRNDDGGSAAKANTFYFAGAEVSVGDLRVVGIAGDPGTPKAGSPKHAAAGGGKSSGKPSAGDRNSRTGAASARASKQQGDAAAATTTVRGASIGLRQQKLAAAAADADQLQVGDTILEFCGEQVCDRPSLVNAVSLTSPLLLRDLTVTVSRPGDARDTTRKIHVRGLPTPGEDAQHRLERVTSSVAGTADAAPPGEPEPMKRLYSLTSTLSAHSGTYGSFRSVLTDDDGNPVLHAASSPLRAPIEAHPAQLSFLAPFVGLATEPLLATLFLPPYVSIINPLSRPASFATSSGAGTATKLQFGDE
jgi:hypothetical protein